MTTPRVSGELTNRGRRSRAALVAAARTVFERDGFRAARITDTGEEFELDRAVAQLTRLWVNATALDESKSVQ